MTTNAAPEITAEQKQEWRTRERNRFDRGEYQLLPAFWTNELWWRYGVRDCDDYYLKLGVARRSGNYLFYSEPNLNHYAHVSTTDGAMVAFTENDAKGVADRQTRMKPGKYLTKFFGDVLTADQIRDLATKFSAEYAPQKLQFAADADAIEHVYTHGPTSCMAYKANDYRSDVHPVRVYGDSDLQVAYIASQADRITARVICWPAKKRYGRVYGDEHRIVPLLKEAGYTSGSLRGARVRLIQHDGGRDYIVMPYVDGIGVGEIDGDFVVLGSGDIDTQPTCGLTRNGPEHRCVLCDRGMTDDDAYGCEGVDGYICSGCEETETVTCERTGNRVLCSDTVEMANGDTWSQRAFAGASSFAVGARVRGGNYGGEIDWMTGLYGTILQASGNAWLVKFDNARGQGHNQDAACWYLLEHEMTLISAPLSLQDAA
jgi:hypothetical protein